jgi:hypothetical protein
LFEEPKGGAAFAGYAAGRHLCTHPYFDCCYYFSNSFAVLAGHLCEFHTEQWGEHCSVPVSCLPHAFRQLIVCRSAVHCLKSWRAALLLQDTRRERAFACTHTSIVAITSPIRLLYWVGTCVNFIPNSEWSVALFLSVDCPTLFCNR